MRQNHKKAKIWSLENEGGSKALVEFMKKSYFIYVCKMSKDVDIFNWALVLIVI